MRFFSLCSLLSILLFPILAEAQEKNYESGQLLVRVHDKSGLRALVTDLAEYNGRPSEARITQSVSPHMNIWVLQFDESIDEKAFLETVQRHPAVHTAQVNHKVSMRSTEPNDPLFGTQWQYVNTGQSGGTPGADIDMDLAWDITTGGLTPNGDTIVVAILDDGISLTHTDFEDNLWVNYGEIPNNGIDDDGNGYVDDYLGWNSQANNDNISGGGHGTPVAGIVGAKGNNGIGVAGVNWNVKLMIIKNDFNTNEAAVLAAYDYPLTMRMRYNETNGDEGAFVVSTNASWGVDFGQPSAAPLWCAFYDTLGVHGILNCGATINGNVDVDANGDLPTACPSDYLISVTNMNHNDVKVTQAGFGTTTIDLGAFGEDAFTTSNPNGYDGFGGTSGATPHVAGTIALLYSAPCPSLSALTQSDPAAAALLVKQYILDGADPNPSLEGITVTGGRLNVHNSLMLLMDNCGPCPPPTQLNASEVSDVSALLSWNSTDSTLSSDLQWRMAGDEDWILVENTASPFLLESLVGCTTYEFRIEDNCASESSGFNNIVTFETDGCCEAPLEFTALGDSTSITLNWSPVLIAQAYNVEVNCSGELSLYGDLQELELVLADFEECSACEFRIQTICLSGEITEWSEPITVQFSGCGACLDISYCPVSDGDTQYEYIADFSFADVNNMSGDNNGFGDFTGTTITVGPGSTYDISMTPGFNGGAFSQQMRVWIDYNQDGVFSNNDELVFSPQNGNGTASGTVTIPLDAPLGLTRLRVGTRFASGQAITPCPSPGFEGEYEDYCVLITGDLPTCEIPSGLNAVVENFTDVTLGWSSVLAATGGYVYALREVVSMVWISSTSVDNFAISTLPPCIDYELRVASVCADGEVSDFSTPFAFSTGCFPDCTEIPEGLGAINISEVGALLQWIPTSEALEYEVNLREVGSIETSTYFTIQPQLDLVDTLEACKTYEYELRAICDGEENRSDFSESLIFETVCSLSAGALSGNELQYSVFPNPFWSGITLQTNSQLAGVINVRIINAIGQTVWSGNESIPGGSYMLELPLSGNLPSGMYFLELRKGTEVGRTKLVKN